MDEKNQKHTTEEITGRMNLMATIFQKDAQIIHLQNEKLEQLQQLYDLEIKMYGRMSKIAAQIFEVQHCEVLNGRVREMVESEWKENCGGDISCRKTDHSTSVHEKLGVYKQKTDAQLKSEEKRRNDVMER